jgi:2,3-bisphosphoglycerate-dependent phosphoglycerate mutase
VTRLLIARHGQTAWNHEGRLQGQTDVELSPFGREQARRLGERLAMEQIDAAYSSDLTRCWETATIALNGRAVGLVPDPRLREVNLGAWQGRTWMELRAERPDEVRWVDQDVVNRAPPGGETRAELQARVAESMSAVAARHPDEQVFVVSHGGALRAFLCGVLLADLRASRRIELDNCGLVIVDLGGENPLLVTWNDLSHLRGLVDPAAAHPAVE